MKTQFKLEKQSFEIVNDLDDILKIIPIFFLDFNEISHIYLCKVSFFFGTVENLLL